MTATYQFAEVGRLPLPGDNVAIATRRLEAGTTIQHQNQTLTLDYTVMEGHRFAIQPIGAGEALLSWELPFGLALQTLQPGQYVINKSALEALRGRALDFPLPPAPNFVDQVKTYTLDEAKFQPSPATPRHMATRIFQGYRRCAERGVGTRNVVVLLGTSSRTGSFVKQLAARLQTEVQAYPNVDGLSPIAHTEGGVAPDGLPPNNLEFTLRTLAGFIANPNVGAVLAVDYGIEPVTNAMLLAYMREHNYPLDDLPHRFLSLSGGFQENLRKAEGIVRELLPLANATARTDESVAHLRIALQCGGSDAFSGISANPLLGWVAHELVRYGGSAALAETDELIGAEPYVLAKVRDLATAQKFLTMMAEFKERAAWHGADAEGNPSGGNKYRGLYNITLKSIGAARKKDPATRLDYAINYAIRMTDPGFYFMDSPGNDLEGIAGQVAAGCNMIFFTTGNGSITNFPYVPTVKVVTTTRRFQLLANDMDVNAGLYQDGMAMDELGNQTFDLMCRIASGQRSVGEKAGHSQVQLWRNWRQSDGSQLEKLLNAPLPPGEPIAIKTDVAPSPIRFTVNRHNGHQASDQIGLILPTSLCAGQVANLIAGRLNKTGLAQPGQLSRFVALAHTEGCGNSAGRFEEMYARTMVGYVTHPLVKHCLLLEHGCEKTHNDYMRHQIAEQGGDPGRLGFASIQLDGGIDKVTQKVEAWFAEQLASAAPTSQESVGVEALRIGLLSDGPVSAEAAQQLAKLTKMIVGAGGLVVVPENTGLLSTAAYRNNLFTQSTVLPSLGYGEHARQNGFHIMETPTEHWVETVTGLAAPGVELILALVNDHPMQTHPLTPVIQMASEPVMQQSYGADLDLLLTGDATDWIDQILARGQQVIEHRYTPRLYQQGNIDFQFTRGLLGVTL
jgi:altronate dehydratase